VPPGVFSGHENWWKHPNKSLRSIDLLMMLDDALSAAFCKAIFQSRQACTLVAATAGGGCPV